MSEQEIYDAEIAAAKAEGYEAGMDKAMEIARQLITEGDHNLYQLIHDIKVSLGRIGTWDHSDWKEDGK